MRRDVVLETDGAELVGPAPLGAEEGDAGRFGHKDGDGRNRPEPGQWRTGCHSDARGGLHRVEGKGFVAMDGDALLFKFNV